MSVLTYGNIIFWRGRSREEDPFFQKWFILSISDFVNKLHPSSDGFYLDHIEFRELQIVPLSFFKDAQIE